MINFYREWKDDKESSKPKPITGTPCKICGKRVNALKDHVEGVHGSGMWMRYLFAEAEQERLHLEAFRRLL